MSYPHNSSLYLEVMVHKTRIRRVLIDGGANLSICTLNFIHALGYPEEEMYSSNKSTRKAYDQEERSSKGSVILPI